MNVSLFARLEFRGSPLPNPSYQDHFQPIAFEVHQRLESHAHDGKPPGLLPN